MLPEGFYGRTKLGGELPQSVGNSPDEKGLETLVTELLFSLKIKVYAMTFGTESFRDESLLILSTLGWREGMKCRDCDFWAVVAEPLYIKIIRFISL